jgi:hypothetical protein
MGTPPRLISNLLGEIPAPLESATEERNIKSSLALPDIMTPGLTKGLRIYDVT